MIREPTPLRHVHGAVVGTDNASSVWREISYSSAKRQKDNTDGEWASISGSTHVNGPDEALIGRNGDILAHESDFRSSAKDPSQAPAPKASLADPVIRSVVSGGNDALNILFEAATHQEEVAQNGIFTDSSPWGRASLDYTPGSMLPPGNVATAPRVVKLSEPSPEVLDVWSHSRFVMTSWLSAEEAVTFIDSFFKTCVRCLQSLLITVKTMTIICNLSRKSRLLPARCS